MQLISQSQSVYSNISKESSQRQLILILQKPHRYIFPIEARESRIL